MTLKIFRAVSNTGEDRIFLDEWKATKWLAGVEKDDFSDFTYPAPGGIVSDEDGPLVAVGIDGGCVRKR